MFKGTKMAVVLLMIVAFTAFTLSGCMPTTGSGLEGGGDAPASGGLMGFLPLVLIIVVFYFILIRPQNKKNKQVNEMRTSLKRGDWVTTIGGFRGRVVRVKDDVLTIEVGSDKVKLEIMRWGISKIEEAAPEKKSSKKDKDIEKDEEPEEAPKRKPKKLTPVAKKEADEDEDEDEEDFDDDDDDDDDDEK